MTVRELLARIDSQELSEWMAFARVQPFGDRRMDERFGILCSALWNISGKVANEPLQPGDFFATLGKLDRQPQSAEEQKLICSAIATTLGQSLSRAAPLKALPA